MLTPPADHYEESHTVGYYGAMVHNVKAVYQRYLSWYDGNPCHLDPHPPVEAGTRYVELAGGADALLASAQEAYDRGDYRWVAELVNHLVFADATNTAARSLLADAYEQLGYQSESATFRNAYLMGAQELRHGHPPRNPAGNRGLLRALPIDQLLATVAMRLNADEVGGVDLAINLVVSDLDERWFVGLSHRALRYRIDKQVDDADATVTTTREVLSAVVAGERTLDDAVDTGDLAVDGDTGALRTIVDHLDVFLGGFPIVEP
jgi:alkyl sulfatase BDS1-like metallo-beta-lactamase superfamily hydrolase